ncbi:MAG TPA: DUF354 domain-containing protein [Candidatus Methanoperedens sp.]
MQKEELKRKRNFLFHVGHPAHVHFFKNTIKNLLNKGFEVNITAMDKEVTIKLLRNYGFAYSIVGKNVKGLFNKMINSIKIEMNLVKIIKLYNPDLLIGVGSPYMAHSGALTGKPYINFGDTEMSKFDFVWTPFTKVLIRPSCYKKEIGRKEIRYDGYHPLAHLHPNYFTPDTSVLEDIGMTENDDFIILRFISGTASHDIGLHGIHKDSEIDLVRSLERFGRVFITSEKKLSKEMEKYRITAPPEKIHSMLYFSRLYLGDGGTMAVEAAILGTPSIHVEATASGKATGETSGVFMELRDKYDLLYFYPDQRQGLEKAHEILNDRNSKKAWQHKRDILIKDKIDVSAWMTDFIERYPASFEEYIQKMK